MARIVCFSDSAALVRAVRLGLSGREHAIFPLPGSRLTDDLRRTVRQLAPDIVLLELSQTLDNPHLFIFLRADEATRNVPVIVLASSPQLDLYATALGADGFLSSTFTPDELVRALAPFIPRRAPALQPLPAPEPAASPARRTPAPARSAIRAPEPRLPGIPALAAALALA
ncbi:MAG TPA: response regulator [Roseiflexaceae bacterium]|nr:response regulator [Roseiflexaceae bacterium]